MILSVLEAPGGAMCGDMEEEVEDGQGWTGSSWSSARGIKRARAVQTATFRPANTPRVPLLYGERCGKCWRSRDSLGVGRRVLRRRRRVCARHVVDRFAGATPVLKRSLNHQSSINHHLIDAMFSTVIRRAMPSLRQARSYTAAAHTQASASSSKLDEGEQAIHDKLSEHFQPSELLVQDVSGACHSHILPTSVSFGKRVFWGGI